MQNKSEQPNRTSGRAARAARKRQQKPVLLAIAVLFVLVAACFVLILFSAIADVIKDNTHTDVGSETDSATVTETETQRATETTTNGNTYQSITLSAEQAKVGPLMLIDADHTIDPALTGNQLVKTFGNVPMATKPDGAQTKAYTLYASDLVLQEEALTAFNRMTIDFVGVTGKVPTLVYAYRSADAQRVIREADVGKSDYHSGYTVGFNSTFANSDEYAWIRENAHKYGYIIRYPDGKDAITQVSGCTYILRYVGVAHATYMYENNLCLEEYLDLLKGYTFDGNHLKVTDAGGMTYEIYYAPASSSEISTVRVPTDGSSYTVSGTNNGGFIITVSK